MALLCLNCFNRIEGMNLTYKDVVCDMDYCESCNKNLPCVAVVAISEEMKEIFKDEIKNNPQEPI